MTHASPDPAKRAVDDAARATSADAAVGKAAGGDPIAPSQPAEPSPPSAADEPETGTGSAAVDSAGDEAVAEAADAGAQAEETGASDPSDTGRFSDADIGPPDRAADETASDPESAFSETVGAAMAPSDDAEPSPSDGGPWRAAARGAGKARLDEPEEIGAEGPPEREAPHPGVAPSDTSPSPAEGPPAEAESEPDAERSSERPAAKPPESVAPAPPLRSRWDAPGDAPSSARDRGADREGRGALVAGVRVAALVLVVVGALYGGLMAVRPEGEAPVVVVQAPRVVETRAVAADPDPAPRPLRVDRFPALRDLDLGGHGFGLVRVVPQPPQAVCEAFAAAGWSGKGWGESPLGGMSECVAERSFGPKGAAGGFAVLRGRETLLEIRVKLNLTDARSRGEAAGAVGTLMAGLFDSWRWDGGPALGARIAALEPFEETHFGTKVVLKREHGDVERWNLILRFPSPPELKDAPGAPTMADIAAATAKRAADISADRDAR